MTWHVENLLVLAIVAVATAYLARRIWGTIAGRRKGGCGACPSCPSQSSAGEPDVVAIETLIAPAGKR